MWSFADDLEVLADAALGPEIIDELAAHGLTPGEYAAMIAAQLPHNERTPMITKHATKSISLVETKDVAPVVVPVVVPVDASAEYRAEDGWREVPDRWGRRIGWFHQQHGFRDDPTSHLRPVADPAKAKVLADPFVVAAERALKDARQGRQAAQDHLVELQQNVRHIRAELPNAFIEYASKADAANGRNGKLVGFTEGDLRRAQLAATEFFRDVVEPAEIAEAKAASAYHDAVTDAYIRHRGQ